MSKSNNNNKQILKKIESYLEQDNTYITHGETKNHIIIVDDNGSLIEEFFLNE